MRLATLRTADGGTTAARVDDGRCLALPAADVGALLDDPGWAAVALDSGEDLGALDDVDLAPVIPDPRKVVCVGLNYATHITEMGRDLPAHPTLFTKFADALIGARDDLVLPACSDAVDWEVELAVVIGAPVRNASTDEAATAIAGFTAMNDVTMRDWQYRTLQWFQGKTFEASSPLGPVLVTPDELPGGTAPVVEVTTQVDGDTVQTAKTDDLVFGPVDLIRYISTIVTLRPGDVIATGTPGGVGHARDPKRYLRSGEVLSTTVAGIGTCSNLVRATDGSTS